MAALVSQQDLFDFHAPLRPRTTARARNTDPDTSRAAAERIALSDLEARTLKAIQAAGERGSTSRETAAALGVDRDSVSPRHPKLERQGFIVRTTMRRDGQIVWVAI